MRCSPGLFHCDDNRHTVGQTFLSALQCAANAADRNVRPTACYSGRGGFTHSVVFAVFVVLNAFSAHGESFNAASSFSGPHPAVVRVVSPERDGVSYGSGSLVAVDQTSGLVVTNWHVVRDAAEPVVVYFPDGFRSRAYVLRTDKDWDLAALAIRRPRVEPIALASEAPQFGDPLTIIGYGTGAYRAEGGHCTQYLSPGGQLPMEMVELSAAAREGDSGGPILNNRGEMAGVLFGTAFGRTTGSYCGRVRMFLASVQGDFQELSKRVMLADEARKSGTPATPVSVAAVQVAPEQRPIEAAVAQNVPAPASASDGRGSRPDNAPGQPDPMALAPLRPIRPRSTLPESPALAKLDRTNVGAVTTSKGTSQPIAACSVPGPAAPAPIAAVPATAPASTTEQLKSVLALIGIVAVLYHIMRLLGAAVG